MLAPKDEFFGGLEMATEYDYAPVDQARYDKSRGIFDGVTGFMDGVANVVNGVGHGVEAATDIRDDLTASKALAEDLRLDVEEREQKLMLNAFKIERGDNLKLYAAAGAVALLAVLLLAR